jgi:hypothetical protein
MISIKHENNRQEYPHESNSKLYHDDCKGTHKVTLFGIPIYKNSWNNKWCGFDENEHKKIGFNK